MKIYVFRFEEGYKVFDFDIKNMEFVREIKDYSFYTTDRNYYYDSTKDRLAYERTNYKHVYAVKDGKAMLIRVIYNKADTTIEEYLEKLQADMWDKLELYFTERTAEGYNEKHQKEEQERQAIKALEREEKQAKEKQRELEEEEAYKKEVFEARQKFIEGQEIPGDIFLQIAEDLKVKISLRTLGFIMQKVCSISVNTYRTSTKGRSEAIWKYIEEVENLLKENA